jgi:hypothetical protein
MIDSGTVGVKRHLSTNKAFELSFGGILGSSIYPIGRGGIPFLRFGGKANA